MSIVTIIAETAIVVAAFAAMVVIMENKDPVGMVADYPPDIQAAYYESQGLQQEKEQITAKNYVAKGIFMVVAVVVVIALAYLAGARTFWQGFWATAVYVIAVFAVETFVIDWIVFPRVKRWRLPGTEDMDEAYAQKWFHVKACLPMVPVFAVFAVIVGVAVMLIG